MAEFTWQPGYNITVTRKPRVLSQRFGDGYEARVADGINAQPAAWSLAWENRQKSEIDSIEAFLAARAGVEAFDWTAPDGVAGRFVCREWQRQIVAANVATLTAQFDEVFE
jgi:phage-related protein